MKLWRHKLSFLEVRGHLLHLMAFAEECQDRVVATRIDNNGSVRMWQKGYDIKCSVNNCLIRTADYVATSLGCQTFVVGTTRRSSGGVVAADALRMNNLREFSQVMVREFGRVKPARTVPRSFLKWLEDPVVDKQLGKRIVDDLEKMGRIKRYF